MPGRALRNFSLSRRLAERTLAFVSGAVWPAAVARRLGFQRQLLIDEHVIEAAHFPDAPPLRIAFAADFHAGPTTHPRLLEQACHALDSAQPDVLLLGGDFICYKPAFARALVGMLGQVRARFGKYAVLGNHDYWAGADEVAELLVAAGIEVLTNSNVRLPSPYDAVTICGLDDHTSGFPDAERAFDGAGDVRILLMHSPSGLLDIGHHEFDVALSGHTHGGQIALPGGFPLYVPAGRLSRRFVHGRHRWNGAAKQAVVIVSRGVGCSSVPVRLFAPPDIVLCTVQRA